jgi:hypothetical protein
MVEQYLTAKRLIAVRMSSSIFCTSNLCGFGTGWPQMNVSVT